MEELSLNNLSLKTAKQKLSSLLKDNHFFEISISYESDFRNARILRDLTDMICKYFGVDAKWRTRTVLIIDELNNNAIEYGSKLGEKNIFYISLKKNIQGNIVIDVSVTDSGCGEKSKTAQEMEIIRSEYEKEDFTKHDSIRGRGLFLIIARLVDSLDFHDSLEGGLRVHIQKELSVEL